MDVERKGFVRRFLNTEIPQEENEKFFSFARAKRGARIGAAAGFGISSALSAGALAYASIKIGGEITVSDIKDAGEAIGIIVGFHTGAYATLGSAVDTVRPISKSNENFWKPKKADVIWVAQKAKQAASKVRSSTRNR